MFTRDHFKNWFGFLLNFAVIFYLSSRQGGGGSLLPFESSDKALHFFIYFLLGINFTKAIYHQDRFWRLKYRWLLLGLFFAPLFAVFDEWHQSFVVGRSVEFLDGVADVSGFVLAMLSFELSQRTTTKKRFLPLVEMRQNIWLYRLNMSWLLLVVVAWEVYFVMHPLHGSKFTQQLGRPQFIVFWKFGLGAILGFLWARSWLWECWWQSRLNSKLWLNSGLVVGILFLSVDEILRWHFQIQTRNPLTHLYSMMSFAVVYWLYLWGWKSSQSLAHKPKATTEALSCELP